MSQKAPTRLKSEALRVFSGYRDARYFGLVGAFCVQFNKTGEEDVVKETERASEPEGASGGGCAKRMIDSMYTIESPGRFVSVLA